MGRLLLATCVLLISLPAAFAELEPGAEVPNPTLTAPDGTKTPLHDMFGAVTVLHLWECN